MRAGWVQAILAAIQFRMLHVLIYRTDIVPVILCGCEIWCLMTRTQTEGCTGFTFHVYLVALFQFPHYTEFVFVMYWVAVNFWTITRSNFVPCELA